MIPTSFWITDYPRPADLPVVEMLPAEVDVAVIGGGFTGLSAARTLAKSGLSAVVLERNTIGWGASSRNAGITGCGLKAGAPTIFKRYGEVYGRKFWQASLDALDLIRELVTDEGIDCDLQPNGDLCVAYKPSHYENFKTKIEWHQKNLDHTLHLVPPDELNAEIGTTAYFGGLVDDHGIGLHPAKLVFGLAEVAAQYGAQLVETCRVTQIEKIPQGFRVITNKGDLVADEVIVATNGYTDKTLPKLKPRVFSGGSYSIVTEPLSPELQAEISPKGRMFWDSKWFLNYFRLTPDGRLLWGGRNNLSTHLDLDESAKTLHEGMLRAFPQLEGIPITHTWTGQLGLTFDLMPHIGRIEGVYYALGYGGHGLHTALLLGRESAQLITGEKSGSPFLEIPHKTYFFYRNHPWFLPLAALNFRIRDYLS
ncbi:MAG TPA: FAD-binding oxidoreductase [Anaerolineales bacterium]|nr:FAD-binding oxidoreductase [Anaerolineales bacterium]